MLLVKASPKPSKIHGLGLFAEEDIMPFTTVWRFMAGDCRHAIKDIELWHPKAKEWIWQHGYINPDNPDFIVACGDHSIYMNFASPANTALGGETDGEVDLIALTYIIAGHEITVPYSSDADAERKMKPLHLKRR